MKIEDLKLIIEDVNRLHATLERIDEMRKNLGLSKRQIRKMVKFKISTARF